MHDLTLLSAEELALLEHAVSRERARRQSAGEGEPHEAAVCRLMTAFGWRRSSHPGLLATADGRRVLVRAAAAGHGTFASIPDPADEAYDLIACVVLDPASGAVARGVLVTRAEAAVRGNVLACGEVELPLAALSLGRGVHDITDALRRCVVPPPARGAAPALHRPSPRALLRAQLAASLALAAAPRG